MKTRSILLSHLFSALILLLTAAARSVSAQSAGTIHEATLMESDQRTKEISTEDLRKILAEKSATVFDARPFNEYAISHIPGAVNVSAKPDVPISFPFRM